MDQRYKNNDQWVYMNGELYHAGVKGMHWYQHLPGTDWWKVGKKYYQTYMNRNPNMVKSTYTDANGRDRAVTVTAPHTTKQKLQGIAKAAGFAGRAALSSAKGYLRGEARYYGQKLSKKARSAYTSASKFASQVSGKLSDFARNAWSEARNATRTYIAAAKGRKEKITVSSSMSYLDTLQNRQMDEAIQNYKDGKVNGSVGNTINQFIQNAQYGIVKGVNSYLKQMKLDDDVDRFLAKISGGKTRVSANRYIKDNTIAKPSSSYNSNAQRAEQSYERNYQSPEERRRANQQNRTR